MKKLILLVMLLLSYSVTSATSVLVGGSNSSSNFAGWCDDDRVADSHVGGNGSSVDNVTGTVSDSGGFVRITSGGGPLFNDAEIGLYINSDFTATHADGRYRITAVDASNNWIDINLAYISGAESVQVWVGGAVPIEDATFGLQEVLDDTTIGSAGAQNVNILITGPGTFTAANAEFAGVTMDQGGGAAGFRKRIIAANSSYIETIGGCTLTESALMIGGLLQVGSISYTEIRGVIFNGGGAGGATYGVYYAQADSDNHVLIDCRFTNVTEGTAFGCGLEGDIYTIVGCEFDACDTGLGALGSDGANSLIHGCIMHDNIGSGAFWDGAGTFWNNNLLYHNGGDGLELSNSATNNQVTNCTFERNTVDGVSVDTTSTFVGVFNNSSSNNGGYGYGISSNDVTNLAIFGWNHSDGNTSGDSTDTGTWATLGMGNNISGNPNYRSTTDGLEDYRPGDPTESILIDAGKSNGHGGTVAGGAYIRDLPLVTNVLPADTVNDVTGTAVGGSGTVIRIGGKQK